ncbi:SIR2 family protein [Lysinibacillus sp. NPDC098008]|uniref:SIR2 family protein n=1 Tax=Lysinibacillus sp. NPDC098008 TaxID=3364146 RepID=UPI00382F9378
MVIIIHKGNALDVMLKYVCSGNINFIIGSGASFPAIKTLGNLEEDITSLVAQHSKEPMGNFKEEIAKKINGFIMDSIIPNKMLMRLIKPSKNNKFRYRLVRVEKRFRLNEMSEGIINYLINIKRALVNYRKFIRIIYELLLMRANDKYPKKINIFTTNYDLFFEAACELLDIPYNEGGNGYIRRTFSTKNFQKKIIRLSDYYSYSYEEPIINILKLHGSVNWSIGKSDIEIKNAVVLRDVDTEHINERGHITNLNVPIILPTKQKFVRTLLEHIYYDMSRFYANELEREQSVLFCFGFSFADEHIRSITKRALGNPSLTLIIFPFSIKDEIDLYHLFKSYNNVKIVRLEKSSDEIDVRFVDKPIDADKRINIDFTAFISLFEELKAKAKN